MAAAPLGGQSPAPPQQPPTFRAEARAIEVDAYVTDAKGAFVRDLAREDFEILEDGQAQEISTFTLVDVPVEPRQAREARAAPLVDPDVTTNATDGRIYVMLLDSPGMGIDEYAYVRLNTMFVFTQRVARRFVDEALGPHDLMSVIHVQDSRGDAQSFTSNKSLLRASIDRLKPDMFESTSNCDASKIRNSYEMLETVSERLGALTGRRKAILWVNGRVPFDPVYACGGAAAGPIAFMYRDAMRAATRNNVAIYPIDSVGLTADPDPTAGQTGVKLNRLMRLAALRSMAEDTGGEAIVNTNNFSAGYERIVRRHSTYYLLGYRPTQEHRDGKFHAITVRVRQPGLSVRARQGYYAPEPGAPLEARLLPDVSAEAGGALVRSLPSSGLGLQLFLAPFKGAGKDASVLVGAEVHGLARGGAAEPRVEISYLAIDAQGKTRVAPPILVPLPLAGRGVADDGPLRYVDRLVLPPGRHELRMAMHQPGGDTGSIVAHVEVPDFTRGRLAMSGVALVASEAAAPPVLVGYAPLAGTAAAGATTRRRFTPSETITAFVEVYSEPRTRVEDVAMTVTIASAAAPGTKVASDAVPATVEPGRIGYSVRLPLADLVPGDYVLTLDAAAARETARRQVPLTVIED